MGILRRLVTEATVTHVGHERRLLASGSVLKLEIENPGGSVEDLITEEVPVDKQWDTEVSVRIKEL